uniref:Peptide transport periplasmic protein SapA n=1 Tax=Klebsiella pneumoniae TaxID=573 RepID=A0A8B0SVP6_KLEPN|nr:Peptide transport periplasmic protein SapA [Klebsiella pneumoniae]
MTTKLKLPSTTRQKSREQLKALGLENLTLQLWVPTSSQARNPSPLKNRRADSG